MIVAGLMSGTSVDAIDLAVADLTWHGPDIVLQPLHHAEHPWPAATRARLLAALPPQDTSMAEVCALDVLVGEAFGAVAAQAEGAVLVASHGQTVFHWTQDGKTRGSLQIGQPAAIVEATGLPVVSDFRARDVAAGGQGAPLASTLDALWLAGDVSRAALNLGGIANITVVGKDGLLAFDTGPASCLMDLEAARMTQGVQSADIDGRIARAGRVRPDLLARLLADPYYARPAPKSTGREWFDRLYVASHLAGLPAVSDTDLMATLAELTAATVADACARHGVMEVIASGGGVHNPALMDALQRRLAPAVLTTSEARGLPSDAKEAYLFALLGFLTWHGVPGTVHGATGADTPRVLGRISPGNAPLRLPEPHAPPRALVIEAPERYSSVEN
jgi:anhydro-N-acetylmuramic acid kinase